MREEEGFEFGESLVSMEPTYYREWSSHFQY